MHARDSKSANNHESGMKKTKEIEELIKRMIRDEIALYPLKSVAQVRVALYKQGYQSLDAPLDWHYVSKLMKQARRENLAELTSQSRTERFANLKERHRIITQKLASILDGEPMPRTHDVSYPSHADRLVAANTILKWDMAIFFAEEQVAQSQTIEQPLLLPVGTDRIRRCVSVSPFLLEASQHNLVTS